MPTRATMRVMSKTHDYGIFFPRGAFIVLGAINKIIRFFEQVLLFQTLFYYGQESMRLRLWSGLALCISILSMAKFKASQ